jgi:hypothetical protein
MAGVSLPSRDSPSRRASREVWLRFRGLAFARWDDGRIFFGCPDARDELRPSSLPALKNLLQQLENHRHALAAETRHALYRAHPERWLEALVREDVTRVDAALDPCFVYSQGLHVPAASTVFLISSR